MTINAVTALRKSGKLKEAYELAHAEYVKEPENLWTKRALAFVYYDYLKQSVETEHYNAVLKCLVSISKLSMPASEVVFYEQIQWQAGKYIGKLCDTGLEEKARGLVECLEQFPPVIPSAGASFLFSKIHKILKETNDYLNFVDWWGIRNFREEDYRPVQRTEGKGIMPIAEQCFIAYAKYLIRQSTEAPEKKYLSKAKVFLPELERCIGKIPGSYFLLYYRVQILEVIGEVSAAIEGCKKLLRIKPHEFWVWKLMADLQKGNEEMRFACLCKALSCRAPEKMLLQIRTEMANVLWTRKDYSGARTELEKVVQERCANGFAIPAEIIEKQQDVRYREARGKLDNTDIYRRYEGQASAFVYDGVQEYAVVQRVNTEKQIVHFICNEKKYGFGKMVRSGGVLVAGDIIEIVTGEGVPGSFYPVLKAEKTEEITALGSVLKPVEATVKMHPGKNFGFAGSVYIHPTVVKRYGLAAGMKITGKAVKEYNGEKKTWGWSLVTVLNKAVG